MKFIFGVLLICFLNGSDAIKEHFNQDVEKFFPMLNEENAGNSTVRILDRSRRSQRNKDKGDESCENCGRINDEGTLLIIGGNEVKPPYRYPWMVSLQTEGTAFCGGAIISDRVILTAAHCLRRNTDADDSPVKPKEAGEMEYLNPKELVVAFITETDAVKKGPPIEKIIPHPEFDINEMKHDIALLKLSERITCSKYVNPICLPSASKRFSEGTDFVTAGWGTEVSGSKDSAKHLKQANIKNLDFKDCEGDFPKYLEPYYFCLKGIKDETPCLGDSGGPLFVQDNKKYYVIGVSSMHGSVKCTLNEPFIYTSVRKYIKWIKQNMQQDSSGQEENYLRGSKKRSKKRGRSSNSGKYMQLPGSKKRKCRKN